MWWICTPRSIDDAYKYGSSPSTPCLLQESVRNQHAATSLGWSSDHLSPCPGPAMPWLPHLSVEVSPDKICFLTCEDFLYQVESFLMILIDWLYQPLCSFRFAVPLSLLWCGFYALIVFYFVFYVVGLRHHPGSHRKVLLLKYLFHPEWIVSSTLSLANLK